MFTRDASQWNLYFHQFHISTNEGNLCRGNLLSINNNSPSTLIVFYEKTARRDKAKKCANPDGHWAINLPVIKITRVGLDPADQIHVPTIYYLL
jgi:hypothetical protein